MSQHPEMWVIFDRVINKVLPYVYHSYEQAVKFITDTDEEGALAERYLIHGVDRYVD